MRIPLPTAGLADIFYLGWAAPLLLALFVRPTQSETAAFERALECLQVLVVLTITYIVMFSASSLNSKTELDLNTLRVYNIQNAVLVSLFTFQAFTDKSRMRGPMSRVAIFLTFYSVCIAIWNHGSTFWGFATFDMLISDVVMPKMNGQELLEQFRRLHPSACALLISGYTGRAADHSIPEGAGFMQKPFSLPHLTARIRELLNQRIPVACQ